MSDSLAGVVRKHRMQSVVRAARVLADADAALNEALAKAVLDGASMREIAIAAGLAPNSVPPRLAKTGYFDRHLENGRVTSASVIRTRYDREREAVAG